MCNTPRFAATAVAVLLCCLLQVVPAVLLSQTPVVPENSLNILDFWGYFGPKTGYMDNPVLVAEPHGAYTEQSIYIKYSDHSEHYSWEWNLEVVHKFELPHGSTVNDLWLWIGDNVMKAIVIDTWTGRHIYDSIRTIRRDPAFLAKTGDQYELHIFPMQTGVPRKIKMTFITPTQWTGTRAAVELPMKFLQASGNSPKPLVVLVRERDRSAWENPAITELPSQTFQSVIDTNGYHFIRTDIANTAGLTSLHLAYNGFFSDGMMFSGNDAANSGGHFQFGYIPETLFGTVKDAGPRNVVVGLDFSGVQTDAFHTVLQSIRGALGRAIRPEDSFTIIASKPGRTDLVTPSALKGSTTVVDSAFYAFEHGALGRDIDSLCPRSIMFTDANALSCWGFAGIDSITSMTVRTSLVDAMDRITSVGTIAGYNYGFEDAGPTAVRYSEIKAKLDSFFTGGGRFVGFYDHNRDRAGDTLSHTWFPGLSAKAYAGVGTWLYRNASGRIGPLLPEKFLDATFDRLTYTPDPSIVVELADSAGNPVIISKKVGDGLFVLSGLWSFHDNDIKRKALGIALLGIPAALRPAARQLPAILNRIRSEQSIHPAQTALIFSNSDSVMSTDSLRYWTAGYCSGFAVAPPSMKFFSMIDGVRRKAPYITINDARYYGSAFLMKIIADSTAGTYLDGYRSTWADVAESFAFDSTVPLTRFGVGIQADDGGGSILQRRNVFIESSDLGRARFIVGKSTATTALSFTINAGRAGSADVLTKSGRFLLSHDSTRTDQIIPTMLANENILDKFRQIAELGHPTAADTQWIVRTAVQFRLVCDYTAMLALEPNDTLHFMDKPFDESRFATGVTDEPFTMDDSLAVETFPNPFNSTTTIRIGTRAASDVALGIYDILGRRVAAYDERSAQGGAVTFRWNGTDADGRQLATGIYFVRVTVQNLSTGRMDARVKKLLLMK